MLNLSTIKSCISHLFLILTNVVKSGVYWFELSKYFLILRKTVYLVIIMNELQQEFGKCVKNFKLARKQISECIQKAMDRGLSQKEIMAVADRYLTGDCELCSAIVFSEIMKYEFKEKIHPDYEK